MPLSKAALVASIGCGSFVLIVGIACLVLGLQGYFTFKDPCMVMQSFEMKTFELGNPEEGGGNAIASALGKLTGGLVKTQVEMTMALVMEVNNTNPFDLDYEQDGVGTIVIPAGEITGLSKDMEIGDWTIPKGTLKGNAVNEIPVTMNAIVDLASSESAALTANFVTGGPMTFRITGGIKGEGWVPGLSGENTFVCLTRMDNVATIGEGADVRCRHSTNVAGQTVEGEFESQESFFEAQVVDPACYV